MVLLAWSVGTAACNVSAKSPQKRQPRKKKELWKLGQLSITAIILLQLLVFSSWALVQSLFVSTLLAEERMVTRFEFLTLFYTTKKLKSDFSSYPKLLYTMHTTL